MKQDKIRHMKKAKSEPDDQGIALVILPKSSAGLLGQTK